MNWTDEERELSCRAAEAAFIGVTEWDGDVRADCDARGVTSYLHRVAAVIMDRAVELVAARGGPMTAEELSGDLSIIKDNWPTTGVALREHVSEQGARVATLEQQARKDAADLHGYTIFVGPCVHGRDPWDRCDECGEETAIHALMKVRQKLEQHVSELEKSLESARESVIREGMERDLWKKRTEGAAHMLSDVIPGEVGHLDLVARITELKRQRDEALADNAALWSSLNSILAHVEMNADMRARCQGDFAHASWVRDTRHPGAALLERLKGLETTESLRKAEALP